MKMRRNIIIIALVMLLLTTTFISVTQANGSPNERDVRILEIKIKPGLIINEGDHFSVFVLYRGRPVEDAEVWFNNRVKTTNINGSVVFVAPQVTKDKIFLIVASKPGFSSAREKILVKNIPEPQLIIDAPEFVYENRWFDVNINSNGLPIENACVIFSNVYYSKIGYTNSDGIVSFLAPEVEEDTLFGIAADKSGYEPASTTITVLDVLELPSIVYVDDDYDYNTPGWGYDHFDKIQDGINAVDTDGTIYVYNGAYYENVIINKPLDLIGENRDTTIIDGCGMSNVIYVCADWVSIYGFTIKNSGIGYYDSGVKIYNSEYCNLTNNFIFNNSQGVSIEFSHHTVILGNYFDNRVNDTRIICSNYNIIKENDVNSYCMGITLVYSNNNKIKYNKVRHSSNFGIHIGGSFNTVVGNNICNNSGTGIHVEGQYNTIFHNNFINNSQQAFDRGNNTWDNGYPSGGNYWSDFDELSEGAWDNNSDGIVDTPYSVLGGSNQDNYPFMNPNGWEEPILPPGVVYVDDDFDDNTPGWGYDHFDKIQEGIDAVKENGTVNVMSGHFQETLLIEKPLSLIGSNRSTDGSSVIDGHNCSRLPVISVLNTNHVVIKEFEIINGRLDGINVFDSHFVDILNNIIRNNFRHGVIINLSTRINVCYNTISSHTHSGVLAHQSSSHINIRTNMITENRIGISLNGVYTALIYDNYICNSSYAGLYLYYSSYIDVIANYFINNAEAIIESTGCKNITYSGNIKI
jgi:parallel beta-helix repeat protein